MSPPAPSTSPAKQTFQHLPVEETTFKEYLSHNAIGDILALTLWEAHKPVIRGKLIQQAASLKNLLLNLDADFHNLHVTQTMSSPFLLDKLSPHLSTKSRHQAISQNHGLATIIGQLIHFDQTGFVPIRQAGDNVRRALLLSHDAKTCFLSIDIRKAFDSVTWPYLQYTLQRWGFGSNFLTWVLFPLQ